MIFSVFLLFLFSHTALVLGSAIPVLAPTKRATVCNGHAELCNRQYSNVTFVGAHDSFAFSQNPLAFSRDQKLDIPSQLAQGVRLLQAQAHMNGNDLHFCHTSCLLFDGGKVSNYLQQVKAFLDRNPNEVLTLLFTNPESKEVASVWKPLFDEAGLSSMAYVPPNMPMKYSDWPTLGEMIESGKRLVVFLDIIPSGPSVDFILPEFQMIWETPYSVTDAKFPCKIDRLAGPLSVPDHMYLINHSLNKNIIPIGSGVIVSNPMAAKETNSVASILAHANGCASFGSDRAPNFILLDWIGDGEPFKAADLLNGLA